MLVASAKAICDTDAGTGADLRAALAAAGLAVQTTEGDASSLVWALPALFKLPADDTHPGQRDAHQDGTTDEQQDEEEEEDDDTDSS